MQTTLLTLEGPCVGRMEGLWKRTDAEQIWVRPIRKAEELPRQGLPQLMYTTYAGMISPFNSRACHLFTDDS